MNAANLRVEGNEQEIRIYRGEAQTPIVVQQAVADQRPYIHPVLAPDGKGILTENAPSHHPWQHGIYVGLNDVNGVGFWEEGVRNNPMDGSFHPKPLRPANVSGDHANWVVEAQWRDPAGKPMLTERQQWQLHDRGSTYEIDFRWSLHAEIDLTFGQYAYGGLFLRMPYREQRDAMALNSEGQAGAEAEGKRARWVACSLRVDGREDAAGIAFMDHPSNPEHPVPWRVDHQLGISPSRCIAGPWTLKKGEIQTYHHRVFVFCGEMAPSRIEQSWQAYASQSDLASNSNKE